MNICRAVSDMTSHHAGGNLSWNTHTFLWDWTLWFNNRHPHFHNGRLMLHYRPDEIRKLTWAYYMEGGIMEQETGIFETPLDMRSPQEHSASGVYQIPIFTWDTVLTSWSWFETWHQSIEPGRQEHTHHEMIRDISQNLCHDYDHDLSQNRSPQPHYGPMLTTGSRL